MAFRLCWTTFPDFFSKLNHSPASYETYVAGCEEAVCVDSPINCYNSSTLHVLGAMYLAFIICKIKVTNDISLWTSSLVYVCIYSVLTTQFLMYQ